MNRRNFIAGTVAVTATTGCLGYTVVQEEQIEDLQDEKENVEHELESTEGELADKEDRLEAIQSDLSQKEAKINSLQEDLDEKAATIETLESKKDDLELQISTKSDEIQSLQSELEQAYDEVESLENKIVFQEEDISSLEKEISSINLKIEELENEIHNLTGKHDFTEVTLNDALEIGEEWRSGVVKVVTDQSQGTGFHYRDGVYLTNEHVVWDANEITLHHYTDSGWSDGWELDVAILGMDYEDDVAALGSTNSTTSHVGTQNFANPSAGDPILKIGHPQFVGRWIISLGRFDSYEQHPYEGYNYRGVSTIPSQGGSSGSPVFDTNGGWVGMHAAARSQQEQLHSPDKILTDFNKFDTYALHVPAQRIFHHLDNWGVI